MKKFRNAMPAIFLASSCLVAPQALAQQPLQVEEVISRGEYIPDVMRETSAVSSVLTLQDLQRAGDSNAASALTRLSGVSLMSGRFVYVRGLGERYSSALLNGSPLPSPEPLQRVVPLDLFPSNILSNMVVQKSFSASMPGEFGGGVINLSTVGVPQEAFFTAGLSVGGNSRTVGGQGLYYYGSSTDRLGFDSGNRDVPDPVKAAFAAGKRIGESNFSDVELMRIGRSFVNAPLNLLQRQKVSPDIGGKFSGGASVDLGWGRLGFIAVGSFDSEWRTRKGIQQAPFSDGATLTKAADFNFESNQNDIVMSGLGAVGLEAGGHKVQWTNFVVRSVSKEARSRVGLDGFFSNREVRDDYTEWFERELISSQLSGSHTWDRFMADWRAAYARTTRDAPYQKEIRYELISGEYRHDTSRQQNRTSFSTLGDTIQSAGLDLSYSLPLSSARDAVFSAGVAYSDNKRNAEARQFTFIVNGSLPTDVQTERVDFLLSDFNIDPNRLVLREITGANGAAAYNGRLEVTGGYFQVDAEILPFIRTAAGVRVEEATQSVTTFDLFGGPPPVSPAPLQKTYFLPTGTVTWNFADDWQLRVGASQTIARPQFRELAPQEYLDPDSDRFFIGNPFLVDSELLNIDVRLERYLPFGDFITAAFFYKDIDRPVESVVSVSSSSTVVQTYINAPKARIMGGEAEIKKTFDFGWTNPWLVNKVWLVQANYTYSNSEVIVGPGDVVIPNDFFGLPLPAPLYLTNGSRMQGQSDHLANLQFGFEDQVADIQATLMATWVSDRIVARGQPGYPDIIQTPGIMLDFNLRYGIALGGEDFNLGFNVRNLLDTEFKEFQKLGNSIVYNNRYTMGANFSFSLSKDF